MWWSLSKLVVGWRSAISKFDSQSHNVPVRPFYQKYSRSLAVTQQSFHAIMRPSSLVVDEMVVATQESGIAFTLGVLDGSWYTGGKLISFVRSRLSILPTFRLSELRKLQGKTDNEKGLCGPSRNCNCIACSAVQLGAIAFEVRSYIDFQSVFPESRKSRPNQPGLLFTFRLKYNPIVSGLKCTIEVGVVNLG